MGSKRALQEVDPFSLPVGLKVGPWRVTGWRGRGAYGTLYCVEREGREQGEFALKLAIHSGDERFGREAELLRRIDSGHVPRFREQGVWEHPAGAFPYVVMQLVEGEPLYTWAERRNPTSYQVLTLLAQVARALEATHAAAGVHRDVKGANVLVQAGDGRAFLTDFGAGVYRGAATLTLRILPPGTSNYRSPEAWAYERLFALHPSAHYRASVCDDLFALGVTAYRLVTDEYPPLTDPTMVGSEVWERGGAGPRPPRELNANVCAELNTLILRLLGPPEKRFKGQAQLAAEALEHATATAGAEADARLFEWESLKRTSWSLEEQREAELCGHRPRRRDRDTVQHREHQDAEAKATRLKEQPKKADGAKPQARAEHSRETAFRQLLWVLPGAATLALVLSPQAKYEPGQQQEEPEEDQAAQRDAGKADGGTSLGEETSAAVSVESRAPLSWPGVTAGMPKDPLHGQRRPPCNLDGAIVIRSGCWLTNSNKKPPCEEGFYEWNGGCYWPILSQARVPTSEPR